MQVLGSLVSIVIPTMNSAPTLELCLRSIENQTFQNIEVIVVDTSSTDNTIQIASRHGAIIVRTQQRLLGARILGFERSRGEFILMLDSDQILEDDALNRCVEAGIDYDMIFLEEQSYRAETLVEKLFYMDRTLINRSYSEQIDPHRGAMLPRFFKRETLSKAVLAIPQAFRHFVVAHDHAIIYYEAYKVSKKVGLVRNAVSHTEPRNYVELWKKNFTYGRSSKLLADSGYYSDLLRTKIRFRTVSSVDWRLRLASSILSCLKGIPYWAGYLSG